ncbi:MAG TPA: sigma-70 family RNA polymerase sigma factor [Phycisphaerales bacterium]|nr:sigma-70 family RNA polymerase sigma factor [Phycisphaerales bacterium]HMP36153.1 sigma-70 family RNA polymerase sigma factor [Phycisphaerales bacterium]
MPAPDSSNSDGDRPGARSAGSHRAGDSERDSAAGDPGARRPATDTTRLLDRMSEGDPAAAEDLLPVVYEELRRIAAAAMRQERADHTLQPTAIVHEAYLRLIGGQPVKWQGRAHFMGVAAGAIRRVLIDHARRTRTAKRGGDRQRVTLAEQPDDRRATGTEVDLLDLHAALERLEAVNPRQSRVVELRFFGGLTNEDVAEVMGLSRSTVSDEIAFARAWLAKELAVR